MRGKEWSEGEDEILDEPIDECMAETEPQICMTKLLLV